MAWFASDLQQECAEDMKANNAIVMQTLKGSSRRYALRRVRLSNVMY